MRKVTVEAAFYTVNSGVVGLTGKQAEPRAHNLKVVKADKRTGDGEYEVTAPIQFKQGESFGFSGNVGKNGQLRDPEAEELKRMEQAETLEKAVKLARQEAQRDYAVELKAQVAAARDEVLEALLAKLPEEIKPAVSKAIGELKAG